MFAFATELCKCYLLLAHNWKCHFMKIHKLDMLLFESTEKGFATFLKNTYEQANRIKRNILCILTRIYQPALECMYEWRGLEPRQEMSLIFGNYKEMATKVG